MRSYLFWANNLGLEMQPHKNFLEKNPAKKFKKPSKWQNWPRIYSYIQRLNKC